MRGTSTGSLVVASAMAREARVSLLYDAFIWTVPFLTMLTVIVFVHEMGHFLMGRLFGVPIDAFSIGFGPELLHWTDRYGTRWRLAVLPLGGYVKFHGDGDPASMTRADPDIRVRGKTMQLQDVWKRALIVAAGPAVNFLLAIVIFAGLFMFIGHTVTAPVIAGVSAGSPAQAAGFQPGDTVTTVDGAPLASFEDLKRLVVSSESGPMDIVVDRAGQSVELRATPRVEMLDTPFGPAPMKALGLRPNEKDVRVIRLGPLEAVQQGAADTWQIIESIGGFFGGLLTGHESSAQLSGPVGIAKVTAQAAAHGLHNVVWLTALISISIGLLNLLPIPILDGGFLMFFAFEAVRGKALSERTMEISFRIGLSLIATLSIFALYNDTIRPKLQPQAVVIDKK